MAISVDGARELERGSTEQWSKVAIARPRWLPAILAMLGILLAYAALAAPAQGQIVYTHENAIWAMNDDGSGQRPLITAAQTPGVAAPVVVGYPDVFQNAGQTLVFQALSNRGFSCGANCAGIYALTNGSVTRVSQPEGLDLPDVFTFDERPRVTLDSLAAFEYTTDDFNFDSFTTSAATRSLASGSFSSWSTASAQSQTLLPTPDPADASQMAWVQSASGEYYIHVNTRSDTSGGEAHARDPQEIKSLSWSDDGQELLASDGQAIYILELEPGAAKISEPFVGTGVGQARFMGSDNIVFDHEGDIYTIPTSCNACTLADANALTTGGSSSQPAWTSTTTPLAELRPIAGPSGSGKSSSGSSNSPKTSPKSPTPTPIVAPVIANVSQSASKWRVGNRLAVPRPGNPPTGTVFTFNVNVAATISLTVTQTKAGRRVKHRCVGQTQANRKRPKCTQKAVAGVPSFVGHAGLNKILFQGWLSASRKLGPGTYTATLTATVAGAAPSVSPSLSFTIVR